MRPLVMAESIGPVIYGIGFGVVISVLLIGGAINWIRDRRRPQRPEDPQQRPVSPVQDCRGRTLAILRRHWVSAFVIGLAAVLLLVHVSHGLYVVGVLVLAAVVWSSRARHIRRAWRDDLPREDR